MAKLTSDQVCELLRPYLDLHAPRAVCEKVQRYVALLEVWNKKLNLTSVRDPEQVVQRHFGESFYLARLLPEFATLLDVGSGAGFPGLPISLLRPAADVLLAEAQVRKAAFLREAVWMTGSHAKVWAHRVEELEQESRFDVVVLRAVDNMDLALSVAAQRMAPGGTLAFFVGEDARDKMPQGEWSSVEAYDVPLSSGRIVVAKLADAPAPSAAI